ncbi:MAG: molecular chaperone [Geobacteraceae bacterium]|nr:molecular chaperone [Geobacteraceae bacterium]
MDTRMRLILVAIMALIIVGSVQTGWAASFSVAPVRVLLDAQRRTERLAVKNESDRPLTLLIKAYRWTQTPEGMDHYDESVDLIIFPRAVTLAAEEERFIRVGISSPSGAQEQAFRLYLEEQPGKDEQASKGATGRILMRVGIPVFAQPRSPKSALKITDVTMAKGLLHFTLANGGNTFVMAEKITIAGFDTTGAEVFVRDLGGFYLLAGTARTFDSAISQDLCSRVTRISVTTRSEGKEEHNLLTIPFRACER